MDLKHVLKLLSNLEADGKLDGQLLHTLYDPNGYITLTVRAVDVSTREQFLADVAGTVDEAAPEDEPEDESGKDDKPKKQAKLGGKKGK